MLLRKTKEPTPLDREIERLHRVLLTHQPSSEEYRSTAAALSTLYEMKKYQTSSSISKDTALMVGGNLLGILMIIKHEHVNVIASKATSLLLKPK